MFLTWTRVCVRVYLLLEGAELLLESLVLLLPLLLRSGQLFLLLAQALQLLLVVALELLELHLQLVAGRQLGIQLTQTHMKGHTEGDRLC